MGPIPLSEPGNMYVIVCTDYMTKWVETRALPVQTAEEIARFLEEQIVLRHGTPKTVLTDRGTPFKA